MYRSSTSSIPSVFCFYFYFSKSLPPALCCILATLVNRTDLSSQSSHERLLQLTTNFKLKGLLSKKAKKNGSGLEEEHVQGLKNAHGSFS